MQENVNNLLDTLDSFALEQLEDQIRLFEEKLESEKNKEEQRQIKLEIRRVNRLRKQIFHGI